MSLGSAFRSIVMLLLLAAACLAAPVSGTDDSISALPENVVSWSMPNVSSPETLTKNSAQMVADYPRSPSLNSPARPVPTQDWKDELGRKERPSMVTPVMGTALGIGVVVLGMFCSSSVSVQNAFSSKAEAGHKAAVVTGSGIMLGGAAIVSVSLVQLGKVL